LQITVLDVCAYVGLTALGAITLNLSLGVLIAFRYSPVRQWPYRPINYVRLHNLTGYVVLGLCILHPLILLFNPKVKFRIIDIFYPVHSLRQPLENCIGALALYLVAFVVVTSYFRAPLGRRLWKSFHFAVYAAAAAIFWHSLFTDPELNNATVDWLDGGKLFVEACFLFITALAYLRWRQARRAALRS
jgi:predicted ferric reductase